MIALKSLRVRKKATKEKQQILLLLFFESPYIIFEMLLNFKIYYTKKVDIYINYSKQKYCCGNFLMLKSKACNIRYFKLAIKPRVGQIWEIAVAANHIETGVEVFFSGFCNGTFWMGCAFSDILKKKKLSFVKCLFMFNLEKKRRSIFSLTKKNSF